MIRNSKNVGRKEKCNNENICSYNKMVIIYDKTLIQLICKTTSFKTLKQIKYRILLNRKCG